VKHRWRTLVAGLLVAGILAPVTLLAPAPVRAGITVIDQHSETIPWEWILKGDYAQTFTVGRTGMMTAVAVWMFTHPTATVQVAIHPLNAAGFPTGTALSTGYAGVGNNDNFFKFTLVPFPVTAGQRLAIVLHVLSNCAIRGDTANPYKHGMAEEWLNGHWQGFQFVTYTDWAFRTYVNVPLPMVAPKPSTVLVPLATPTPTPTPYPAMAPTPSPASAGNSAASPASVSSGSGTPAVAESPTAVTPAGSQAAAGAATSGGPAGSAESGDSGLPMLAVAAAVAIVLALGGLAFLVLRRRRRVKEAAAETG
jgi:hypothetical protein